MNASQVRVILPHSADYTLLKFDDSHSQGIKMPLEKVASLIDAELRGLK